jgi:hypothetical protein
VIVVPTLPTVKSPGVRIALVIESGITLFNAVEMPLSLVTPALVVKTQLIPAMGVVEKGLTKLPTVMGKLPIVALPKVPNVMVA